ncbi:MAG: hypothetical protein H8D67_21390 [Deltaproteobacteria bacterium]|nr:hypothetical protein [Deltaproteobacteria bacterium]
MKITHEIPLEVLLENPPVTEMPVSTEVDFSALLRREGKNNLKLGAVRLFESVPGVGLITTPVQLTSNYITWILRRSVTDSKLRRFKLCVDFCDSKTIVTRPYFPSIRVLPVPNNKISFQVDGKEVFGYCYSNEYLKPFFYPVKAPKIILQPEY